VAEDQELGRAAAAEPALVASRPEPLCGVSAHSGDDPARGWRRIDTAPLNTLVDLWCVEGYEEVASYSTGVSIGRMVPRRHKSAEYGWFGNQSNAGVPRGHAHDMIPVAWRPTVPDCPAEMIADALGIPVAPSDSDRDPEGDETAETGSVGEADRARAEGIAQ
jgi:hypothetical protein